MPTSWTERGGSGGVAAPDPQALYERALHALHPTYYPDVTALAHDGWIPEFVVMRTDWYERVGASVAWTGRVSAAATWTERT